MTVLFTPLVAPPEPGKKRRANAKPSVITKIDHFHEDIPLRDFVVKAITCLKREDLFEQSWIFQGHELNEPNSFSLSYTIPRCVTDQVEIGDEKDYKHMLEEATNKSPHEVKVYIAENKVCHLHPPTFLVLHLTAFMALRLELRRRILTRKLSTKKQQDLERNKRCTQSFQAILRLDSIAKTTLG